MISRQEIYRTWHRYYSGIDPDYREVSMRMRAESLEARMRLLARSRERYHRDFDRAELNKVLGMALGVHKQLLWGLTSLPSGGIMEGWRGVEKVK